MTEQHPPEHGTTPPPPPYESFPAFPAPPAPPQGWQAGPTMPPATGPLGETRGTGVCILLTIVTFGIYSLYWFFKVHQEMKDHTGRGIGGPIALLIAFFVGIVMPYITSSEVGGLYSGRGQKPRVTAMTGLWYFPGVFILVGPLVWFVKTNGALNEYWRSLGAN